MLFYYDMLTFKQVKKLGFLNIDGLEPSKAMIDMQPRGLYGNVYKEPISHAKPCTIETGESKIVTK